jgi:hypothetical protein
MLVNDEAVQLGLGHIEAQARGQAQRRIKLQRGKWPFSGKHAQSRVSRRRE